MTTVYICKFAHYSTEGVYIPLGKRICKSDYQNLSWDKKLNWKRASTMKPITQS